MWIFASLVVVAGWESRSGCVGKPAACLRGAAGSVLRGLAVRSGWEQAHSTYTS